jgi:hypothetical protein
MLGVGNPLEVMVLHCSGICFDSVKRDCHLLDTLLFKGIFSFDYHPREFARLIGKDAFKEGFSYQSYRLHSPLTINEILIFETGTTYPQYLEPAKEQVMDRERATIGLESLADLRRKIDFCARNKSDSQFGKYQVSAGGIGASFAAETYEEAKSYIAEFSKYKPQ